MQIMQTCKSTKGRQNGHLPSKAMFRANNIQASVPHMLIKPLEKLKLNHEKKKSENEISIKQVSQHYLVAEQLLHSLQNTVLFGIVGMILGWNL